MSVSSIRHLPWPCFSRHFPSLVYLFSTSLSIVIPSLVFRFVEFCCLFPAILRLHTPKLPPLPPLLPLSLLRLPSRSSVPFSLAVVRNGSFSIRGRTGIPCKHRRPCIILHRCRTTRAVTSVREPSRQTFLFVRDHPPCVPVHAPVQTDRPSLDIDRSAC